MWVSTPNGSLYIQLPNLWDTDLSPAFMAASCSSQSCSCYTGQHRTPNVQPCSGTTAKITSLSPQPAFVCLRADQTTGDQLQAGQGGSEGPAGAQGLRVCIFLYSSSSPPAQVSSCHEEEPQIQGSEKTGFYSSCAAHSHSLETLSCQSYYETNQVPDSGLALPHPQESQHCTKLYLQGKQSEMASPKKTLAIQKKTFKTSVTGTPSTQPASHSLLPGLA